MDDSEKLKKIETHVRIRIAKFNKKLKYHENVNQAIYGIPEAKSAVKELVKIIEIIRPETKPLTWTQAIVKMLNGEKITVPYIKNSVLYFAHGMLYFDFCDPHDINYYGDFFIKEKL